MLVEGINLNDGPKAGRPRTNYAPHSYRSWLEKQIGTLNITPQSLRKRLRLSERDFDQMLAYL